MEDQDRQDAVSSPTLLEEIDAKGLKLVNSIDRIIALFSSLPTQSEAEVEYISLLS